MSASCHALVLARLSARLALPLRASARTLCAAAPRPRRSHRAAATAYLGGMTAFGCVAADEWIDIRKWKGVCA